MLGPFFKLINMTVNLLPFGLVIWGFYSMVWGMNQAGETYTFYDFVQEKTCETPADTYYDSCQSSGSFSWDWNIQVVDLKSAEEGWNDNGVVFVTIFSLINVFWAVLYLKNSGVWKHSYGTVGYHSANVTSQRQSLYKYWGYLVALILFIMTCIGINLLTDTKDIDNARNEAERDAEKDQQAKMQVLFFNGMFQCVLGLQALMTPVPDTIKYGDKITSLKVAGKPWSLSSKIMEKFQDAVNAARGGDNGYLKNLTGCNESDVDAILTDVTPIPFQLGCIEKTTNILLCKGEKNDGSGGDRIELSN